MKNQTEFSLEGVDIPATTLENVKKILRLLQSVTSLSVVAEFLKSKQLPHSAGSWTELEATRILPAVQRREIAVNELARLLAEAEEFGRFHVFLYTAKRKDAELLMERSRIEKTCRNLRLAGVFQEPLIEEIPAKPTLTEIRQDTLTGARCWVFKIVEERLEKRFVSETEDETTVRKEWEKVKVRAVNVARLHESGFLEIRIQSHLSSTQYEADLNRVWLMLKDFLTPTQFSPLSLAKVKTQLWAQRKSLKQKIRFSDSKMQNNAGTTLIASTGREEADLFGDPGATASLDQFIDHGAHCDSSNVWWRPVEGLINREIHVLLSGMNNEFAVPASCTKVEYEFVLNELRANSK